MITEKEIAVVAIALTAALSLCAAAYLKFLLIPITQEAATLSAQRHRSLQLSLQIDRGIIQVNSPDYWAAVEAIAHPR